MKKLLIFTLGIFLTNCTNKEIKIATAGKTIINEVPDNSPIYITKKNGTLNIDRNNTIGSTHWILTIQKDINLEELTPEIQKIVDKKYAKKMHEDNMNIYIAYADTVAKQMAFFPLDIKDLTEKTEKNKKQTIEEYVRESVR